MCTVDGSDAKGDVCVTLAMGLLQGVLVQG